MDKLTPREQADLMALAVLAHGPDTIGTIGTIDDESKMAAALIYLDLEKAGLAVRSFDRGKAGPTYSITSAGRSALASQKKGDGRG